MARQPWQEPRVLMPVFQAPDAPDAVVVELPAAQATEQPVKRKTRTRRTPRRVFPVTVTRLHQEPNPETWALARELCQDPSLLVPQPDGSILIANNSPE